MKLNRETVNQDQIDYKFLIHNFELGDSVIFRDCPGMAAFRLRCVQPPLNSKPPVAFLQRPLDGQVFIRSRDLRQLDKSEPDWERKTDINLDDLDDLDDFDDGLVESDELMAEYEAVSGVPLCEPVTTAATDKASIKSLDRDHKRLSSNKKSVKPRKIRNVVQVLKSLAVVGGGAALAGSGVGAAVVGAGVAVFGGGAALAGSGTGLAVLGSGAGAVLLGRGVVKSKPATRNTSRSRSYNGGGVSRRGGSRSSGGSLSGRSGGGSRRSGSRSVGRSGPRSISSGSSRPRIGR